MRKQIEDLVKLQKIDTETVQVKSVLNGVSKKIEDLDADLKDFEKTIEQQNSVIDALKKQYRDYESDVKLNLEREQKTQAKLRSVKTNKEYQSFLKEIEDIKSKNSDIEDKMIACLDHMEAAEKIISEKKDAYLQLSDEISSEKKSIIQEAEVNKKRLSELDEERVKMSEKVDPELLKKYLIIKKQDRVGLAVVPVENAVCLGCNVNLPPQLYNELFRCESLRFCPNCQRIIYSDHSR